MSSTQRKRTRFGDMGGQACVIGRSPIPGQTHGVIEGGVVHREPEVTGEALHCSAQADRAVQGESQGQTRRCRESDEPEVVMKFRPVKARKGLEGKTGMSFSLVWNGRWWPKAATLAKGGSFFEGPGRGPRENEVSTSRQTWRGSFPAVKAEAESAGFDRSKEYWETGGLHCPKGIEEVLLPKKNLALYSDGSRRGRRRRDA